tara:strand:+ start:2605 stop:2784 length:180 start_codon:yes stop_codon:yes gene_type:complete
MILLGDLVEKFTKATGIKWLTEFVIIKLLGFKTCNCDKRKLKLNNFSKNFTNEKNKNDK